MTRIRKINHVALVVEDIDKALEFWRDSLGISLDHISEVPRERSAVAFLPLGDSEIELVQPTSQDSGVAKYLQKRGPGMHHLCLEVERIDEVLADLKDKGVNLIHEESVLADDGRRYAFIHPKSAFGVLVELYELPETRSQSFPLLETERLLLREFRKSDVQAVFEMCAREGLNQFLEHEPMQSIEDAEKRVNNRIRLFEKGLGCRWAISFKNNPEDVIGSCGYFNVRVGTHTVEIGFEIHPDHWRRGIMTEALTAVLDYSFGESAYFPVNRVEALVDPGNQSSIKLLTRLGFIDEGRRREFGYWKGAYQDVKVFAILRKDWKS